MRSRARRKWTPQCSPTRSPWVRGGLLSVMKPKEGTMLTVSRMISDAAEQLVAGARRVQPSGRHSGEGERALLLTPDLLPVLKEAGVCRFGQARASSRLPRVQIGAGRRGNRRLRGRKSGPGHRRGCTYAGRREEIASLTARVLCNASCPKHFARRWDNSAKSLRI